MSGYLRQRACSELQSGARASEPLFLVPAAALSDRRRQLRKGFSERHREFITYFAPKRALLRNLRWCASGGSDRGPDSAERSRTSDDSDLAAEAVCSAGWRSNLSPKVVLVTCRQR